MPKRLALIFKDRDELPSATDLGELINAALSGSAAPIPPGGKLQLTATGTFASGATKNVTATATWTSSASSVATVVPGLVTCQPNHSHHNRYATISAAVGSVSGSTSVVCEESRH